MYDYLSRSIAKDEESGNKSLSYSFNYIRKVCSIIHLLYEKTR